MDGNNALAQVSDTFAREKTARTLRNILHDQYSSSIKSRAALRKRRENTLNYTADTNHKKNKSSPNIGKDLKSLCERYNKPYVKQSFNFNAPVHIQINVNNYGSKDPVAEDLKDISTQDLFSGEIYDFELNELETNDFLNSQSYHQDPTSTFD